MASCGLVQTAPSIASSLPSKAIRQTVISPRAFQVLARESSQRPPSSSSLLPPQRARAFPYYTPCRAFHGSNRVWAPETLHPKHYDGPHVSKPGSPEKLHGKKPEGSIPAERKYTKLTAPILSELVRKSMRRVPQPVTVITSSNTQIHPDGNPDGWHGATISSFNTVTLTPIPIISFNIKHNSSTFAAIKASGRLWVHFLTTGPFAHILPARFARQREGYPRSLLPDSVEVGEENPTTQQQGSRVPIIPPYNSAHGKVAFILECEYMEDKTVNIGDHVVLFASVAEVINRESNVVYDGMEFHASRSSCLVYADGHYQRVAPLKNPGNENDLSGESQQAK